MKFLNWPRSLKLEEEKIKLTNTTFELFNVDAI